VAVNVDNVLADVRALEAEILVLELAANVKDLRTKFGDLLVETRLFTSEAVEVVKEDIESSCELLEDDNLHFNFANFFQNQLFDEFLENEQLLLNEIDI